MCVSVQICICGLELSLALDVSAISATIIVVTIETVFVIEQIFARGE